MRREGLEQTSRSRDPLDDTLGKFMRESAEFTIWE